MKKDSIPNYLHIFESKLAHLKKRIEKEYERPKKERSKAKLKESIKEAKKLKKTIAAVREEHAAVCPHCGKRV